MLAFDRSGVRLASGSKDTDIIMWDIVGETAQFKLRGHKDQVTGLRFIEPQPESETEMEAQAMAVDSASADGWLVSTGKDSLIKLWDLSLPYCVETHVAQTNEECWALGVSPDCQTCITSGNGGELKIWTLDTLSLLQFRHKAGGVSTTTKYLQVRGTLSRRHGERATEIIFHPKHPYFAVHGPEKSVEVWRERSEAEIKKSLARKRRRRREKAKDEEDVEMQDDNADDTPEADITDIYHPHTLLRTGGKVRSVDWASDHAHKEMKLLVGTTNNQLELYSLKLHKEGKAKKDDVADYTKSLSVELPGHRTDVRSIALSSDSKMLATASNGSLKVWNVKTQVCIRTFECGYALCCAFLPGDKIIVVGTKSGELELFDVVSASLLESVKAHDGAVYGLQVHPDGRSLVSGSADKTAKFWDFKIVREPVLGTMRTTQRLQLAMKPKVIKVSDDILALRFSPDGRYLAVALLDDTVKVFFADSLKLYLNLYGHKLPVISMDISYDSKLIATCSADKTVRIWGLDFGDCHRILLKHTDAIMQVAFVPHNSDGNGHHFFSASKDKTIRYWDGDKFQHIQRLDGHHGEIWALAIAQDGSFIISAAHDKSIRVWRETDEQLFLEEERERELEELYETTLTKSLEQDENGEEAGNEDRNDVGAASKQTMETLTAGERIQEALELGINDLNLLRDWEEQRKINPSVAPPQRHIVFMAQGNISAEVYVMNVLSKIRSAALPDALRVLRFSELPALFIFLKLFAQRGMNVTLTCKILFFMLKAHHRQIVGTQTMRALLDDIRYALRTQLANQRDMVGFNVAALRTIGKRLEEKGVRHFVDEEWEAEEAKRKTLSVKKRGFVQIS